MNPEQIEYLKWIINELNMAIEYNPFTKQICSPLVYDEIVLKDSKITQVDRLIVAAEIYRMVMGGKWRLLDLEHIMASHSDKKQFYKKEIKDDIKHLIDNQEIRNADVLKMCLLLTGVSAEIINDAQYVVQKRYFYKENANKLWSSIGYYNMRDKSIHVSTGGKRKDKKVVFPLEDIIETATHELGHHIYTSIISRRFKTCPGTMKTIRAFLKSVKTSKSELEHKQWIAFYKKDYGSDWEKNQALQIIPKIVYVRYGIENELFAQIISGKTTLAKNKRTELINFLNRECQV